MGQVTIRHLVDHLRHLANPLANPGMTDAQLLERFVAHREETAFEVLVWRHGAMVLGLCRRMLRKEHDAEDAFQATFLALVRKAGSIGNRQALSSWLYKVAYRVALAIQAESSRTETLWGRSDLPGKENADDVLWRDLRPVLDEEVNRLPEKYRAPFVLCYLEGRTNEEVAHQLGCPRGTILSRLARARDQLRRRLLRRGLGSGAALVAAALAQQAMAAVPAALVQGTIQIALGITGGKSAAVASGRVVALTQGVLHAMFMTKLKITLAVVLALGVAGASAGFLGNRGMADSSGTVLADAQESPGSGLPKANKLREEAEDPGKLAKRRYQSQQNLKMIALAMHNFAAAYGHLPAPAIYGKDGKALLSWRVAILPFLEQDNLFKRFKLDEPWDGPNNKKLLSEMPEIYAPVGAQFKEADKTYYQALVGKGAAFEPGKGMRFADITDGTSNTILVVEAGTPVPWTKPEDLPFVDGQALPKFGGLFQGDFHAAFCDGSVHWISRKADGDQLRAAITRDGGEVIKFDLLHGPPSKSPPGKGAGGRLPEENARLRMALETAHQEMVQMKIDVKILRDLLQEIGKESQVQMEQENVKLRQDLEKAREQLEELRREKASLEKELEKRRKK